MEVLRKILFPLSLVYALVVHIRNYLYDRGVLKSQSFGTPTICIGNLSVGGTGKTPMAELLVSLLQDDYEVALLSRGYRRKSSGFVLANSGSTVDELGDEPFQIHSKFPKITVAVDADRANGIRKLQDSRAPDVILLDDAFQHRKVAYGFSILLTTYGNLYSEDWYLPTGSLRDSKREANKAHLIIVTKCPRNLDEVGQGQILRKLNPQPKQRVLFSYLDYDEEAKGSSTPLFLDKFRDKNLTLVTGIANPSPLTAYLKAAGLTFEHLRFKDHHHFSEKELLLLRKKEIILTTEKDYVRLKGKVENVYFLPIKHRFLDNGREILVDRLRKFLNLSGL